MERFKNNGKPAEEGVSAIVPEKRNTLNNRKRQNLLSSKTDEEKRRNVEEGNFREKPRFAVQE